MNKISIKYSLYNHSLIWHVFYFYLYALNAMVKDEGMYMYIRWSSLLV